MKRLRKVLAMLLMATMVLSSMTAFAAETTMDTSRDVSLTIYTYSYSGSEGVEGTGVIGDKDKVPENAELVNGVTFAAYKVADINQKNGELVYDTVAEIAGDLGATISGAMSAVDIENKFTNTVLNKLTPAEKTSKNVGGTDGIAKFSNSDLKGQGLYLVKVVEAPAAISEVVSPFLVSLPMTNVEGTDWIYDVYAFPKNETAKSTITLKKYGKTGNGNAVGVTGAKFVIQKKNNGVWETYTEAGNKGVISMNDTSVKISDLGSGDYRIIETNAPSNDYIMDGVTVREFSVQTDGTVVMDGEAKSTMSVINYKPEVEKEVLVKNGNRNQDSDWKEAADYSVGDRVPFKITSTVPENIADLKHYVLTDVMSKGLTMDSTDQKSFEVTYFNAANAKISNVNVKAVPTYDAAKNQWVLDFSGDVKALSDSNVAAIQVIFTATLNADAVTAGAGNPNTITLEYTNKLYPTVQQDPNKENPNTPEKDTDPSEETNSIQDKVNVYTFGLEVVKTFEGTQPSETVKASFDLYRTILSGETKDTTLKVGNTNVDVKKIGSYTTDATGKITINTSRTGDADKAFSNASYYFVETATAPGYNLLKEPVAAKIQLYYSQTFKTVTTTTSYDKDGNVIATSQTSKGEDKVTYYKDADKTSELTTTTTTVNVVNKKGFILPTTGGTGTILFTVLGLVLMAAAVIVFFGAKKRQHA